MIQRRIDHSRAIALFACIMMLMSSMTPARADRTITDMAGRRVIIADRVARVATIGPVPVLNSFVFALGEARSLVNGLPPNLSGPRWRMQYLVDPDISRRPVLQGGGGAPLVEGLIETKPDIVLTMDRRNVDLAARARTPVVFLAWRQPNDVKAVMRLLGQIYGKTEAAEAYCSYFDMTLGNISTRLAQRSTQRPRVLYANLKRMTQPHLIAEWWIAQAGGRSVTDGDRPTEALTFSREQLLAWDPEVMILSNAAEVAEAYADPRLSTVSAIRNRRVAAIPTGVHLWGNRTVEEPLTVLWAAQLIHPDLFKDWDIKKEVVAFYAMFFKTSLAKPEVERILSGRP
ncbi:Periplasmic binding protein [Nitrobacter winogradskyi Nb-255]|uniref:Periplasmic binding protein n=2 Tax=Nitrobacter winogradskyi TaxID=913 RepID=Q3SQW0_NITWN|nr:Periplasmic binding protein [Nitrobacter winogradskyi Nb-255]